MFISIKPHTPVSQDRLLWQCGGWKFSFESDSHRWCLQNTFIFAWNKAVLFREFIFYVLLDCFTLSVEALCSSEVVVTFYQPTLHNILQDWIFINTAVGPWSIAFSTPNVCNATSVHKRRISIVCAGRV